MHYPLIMNDLKNKEMLSRPIKIKIEEFIKITEAIYFKRFQESSY